MDAALDLSEMSAADLRRVFIKRRMPSSERFRTYFGRATDMNRIESALRQADSGYMVELCDLESEALGLEPHLCSVLGKRFGSVQTIDWDLVPPSGPDVDKKEAQEILEETRQDIEQIPLFGESLYDLMWANYDGRGALEIHWDRLTGRRSWRPSELRWIHPRRISFGPRRELRIINPWRSNGNFTDDGIGVDEVPGKFLWWQPRLFREYPEREGLAPRTLYWMFFKRYSWRMRMILTELFGIPWRIVTQTADTAAGEDVEEVKEAAEKLGSETTAAFGPGVDLKVVQPGRDSSEIFSMTHEEVNFEMSKLVLGQTGTTDATANRAESVIMKGEQDIVHMRDTSGLAERVTQQLVLPDVIANRGMDARVNAPRFVLRAEAPRDAKQELENAGRVISFGIPVAKSQIQEISGLREPEDDESIIVAVSGGVDPVTGLPLPATMKVVEPGKELEEPEGQKDPAETVGELEEAGEDGAKERAEEDVLAASRGAGEEPRRPFRW